MPIVAAIIFLATLISAQAAGLSDLGPAPELAGIEKWLNTAEPLSLNQLRGKVILVDFWDYSCINCVRTLPHVAGWYDKYKDKNFVVIGVHTPEFDFEKETKNVENALKKFKISYPVAQDNNYETWKAYKNQYWPAEYLIDAKGHIRLTHFGEGHYDEMEQAIRGLLQEAGNVLNVEANSLKDATPHYARTPETYLGKNRLERFASSEKVAGGKQVFKSVPSIPENYFAYEGMWDISDERGTAQKGSALTIHFKADKVFLVIAPQKKGDRIKLFLDGRPVDFSTAGKDVSKGELMLDEKRLYSLIDLKGKVESHLLRLEFEDDGIAVYAFTFG